MAVLETRIPDGSSPAPAPSRADAAPRPGRRRPALPTGSGPNLTLVAAGVVVLVLSAVGAILVLRSIGARSAVVVMAIDVPAGRPIERSHLATTSIGGGEGAEAVDASGLDELVGRTAVVALPAGAILHPDHLADQGTAARSVVVGIQIDAGALPVTDMAPGSEVIVLAALAKPASDEAGAARRIGEATVIEVTSGEDQRGITVSLRVPEADVDEVTQAAADDLIQLALVESGH
jgi:hypothetical protein